MAAQGKLAPCTLPRLASHGAANVGAALANALSHLEGLSRHATGQDEASPGGSRGRRPGGHEFVGVFEDDLLLASSEREVRSRIREAMCELPATADMLYLEASWETCAGLQVRPSRPSIVRAARPSGTYHLSLITYCLPLITYDGTYSSLTRARYLSLIACPLSLITDHLSLIMVIVEKVGNSW